MTCNVVAKTNSKEKSRETKYFFTDGVSIAIMCSVHSTSVPKIVDHLKNTYVVEGFFFWQNGSKETLLVE